ncbi:tetratricopeptide repeat protein [Cellulosimicrobium sp. Marseille-Q8652]
MSPLPSTRESALADLRAAVAHLHPDDPAELVAIADDLCALGTPDAAVPFYEEAVGREVPGALYRLGLARYDAGDDAEAFRCFELAGLAGDALGAFMAAQVAHERGDLHAARRWYEQAGSVDGAQERLARVLADLGAGSGRTVGGRPDGASADRLDAGFGQTAREDWETAVEQARSGSMGPDAAVGLLESWAEAGEPRVAPALADLYTRAGRLADAEDLLEQAALAGDAASGTALGVLRLKAGRVPEAMDLWRDAADRGDQDAAELLTRFG